MKRVSLFKVLLLSPMLLSAVVSSGQDFRKSKEVTKAYAIEQGAELSVVNKYGRIQIIPWDKDSIKFKVAIEVRAKKEAKAQGALDGIEIDFVVYQSYIESKTSYTGEGSFWDSMKTKTGNVFSGDKKTSIDYKIYVPGYVNLNLTNKYGDIFLEDHQGLVTIDLSNGDLKARKLSEASHLKMAFAYAKIDEMTTGSINLDHKSEIQLSKVDELDIESRSSRIKIGQANKLTINSYRDKLELNEVKTLLLTGSYSYSEIEHLLTSSVMDTKYGSVDILAITDQVSVLDFTANQTDISFNLPSNRKLVVEAIYNEEAGLFFPEELSNKSTVKEDEEEKLVKTTGSLGPATGIPLQLKITITDGNLQVKQ
jgi:hypothetical protein